MISRFLGRPARRRPLPTAPEGTRIYAVGDVHGRADLLSRLHETIRRDAAAGAPSRRLLIHLGD